MAEINNRQHSSSGGLWKSWPHFLTLQYRVFYLKVKPVRRSVRLDATEQRRSGGPARRLLRARQVQRVESAQPLFVNLSDAISNFLIRNNYFVGE
jgi:hypothetical protein